MAPALLATLPRGTRLTVSGGCRKHIGKTVILLNVDPAGDFAYCEFERTGEGTTLVAAYLEPADEIAEG